MAEINSTANYNNGFPCVTRLDILNNSGVIMEYAENMRGLFAAIERLSSNDIAGEANAEIRSLASIGRGFADLAHNEADAIQECAEKAGVIGYPVQVEVAA